MDVYLTHVNSSWTHQSATCGFTTAVMRCLTRQQRWSQHPEGTLVHHIARPLLYRALVKDTLSQGADIHMFNSLVEWAAENSVFVHPSLRIHRQSTPYRDHTFVVTADVKRLDVLFAIPERMLLGFKDVDDEDDVRDMRKGTVHSDEKHEEAAKGGEGDEESDGDICAFFFKAFGLLVNDILVVLNNRTTDRRWLLGHSLQRIRMLHNAPYLRDDALGSGAHLAGAFLQMVHNFVNAGPLTNKVGREELQWAVSCALSHSTPLAIGSKKSIGVIPFVSLIPHGERELNAVMVARRSADGSRLRAYMERTHPMVFESQRGTREKTVGSADDYVYVVASSDIRVGEQLRMQAMAPVCTREKEADAMWVLTCGAAPPSGSMTSAEAARIQTAVSEELHDLAFRTEKARP